MKLGVITDGISTDLEYALKVMNETGLEYAELQFVWDKEIGDQTEEEIQKIKELITKYNVKVPCITRHNFVGLPIMTTEIEDEAYQKHMEGLKRCIHIAEELGTDMVRVMSGRKEMIIFGENGAERWVASTGAWDNLLKLMEPPVKLAEEKGITLAVEAVYVLFFKAAPAIPTAVLPDGLAVRLRSVLISSKAIYCLLRLHRFYYW